MALNVQPITGVVANGDRPLIAARLCNFKTGGHELLEEHLAWIVGPLRTELAKSPNAWIDIAAYASKKGNAKKNQTLSEQRRDEVKSHIALTGTSAKFIKQEAWGAERSMGDAGDNDGYWRAVEVYAFGSIPIGRVPDPVPPKPPTPIVPYVNPVDEWFVTNLSLNGGTIVAGVGGGGFWGTIKFEHIGGGGEPDVEGRIRLVGGAAGASFGPNIKGSAFVQQALKWIAGNGGLSFAELPSETAGICFRNPIQTKRLRANDFKGDCATVFVSANAAIGGASMYLLFFGLPNDFWTSPSTMAMMAIPGAGSSLLSAVILEKCKGAAFISSVGVGVTASLGAAVNGMGGGIS